MYNRSQWLNIGHFWDKVMRNLSYVCDTKCMGLLGICRSIQGGKVPVKAEEFQARLKRQNEENNSQQFIRDPKNLQVLYKSFKSFLEIVKYNHQFN